MPRSLIVCSGTGIKEHRESAPSAAEALRLVLDHMKLRRPGVRVEDGRGNPVSFFELKELVALEGGKKMSGGPPTRHMSAVVASNRPFRQGLGAVHCTGSAREVHALRKLITQS